MTGTARIVTGWDGAGVEVVGIVDGDQTVKIAREKGGVETLKVGQNERVRMRT